MRHLLLTFFVIITLFAACGAPQSDTASSASEETLARVPASWIGDRVASAQERLTASEAGQHVWQAIEAHGGLDRWFRNGPLAFQFNYQPLDDGTPRNTFEVADYWSARARHQMMDTTVEYGWDGQKAWVSPASAEMPYDARFWALTPYYFVGIPFVLADEGVYLESLGEEMHEGRPHDAIKVTFGENVGDAPDDYYVVYIDQETNLVGVTRYIVSYPAYYPDGEHAPEKFMDWTGYQSIDGITLAEGFDTYWWNDGEPTEHITDITVSRVEFRPDVADTYFEAPEDARMIKEM